MTSVPSIPLSSWEQKIFAFVRQEFSPSPTRWRATLRITLLCMLGTAVIMTLHIPEGEFLIVFFFAVSQPDAWASFRRARLRGIGTLVGGGLSIVTIVTCGDKPWLFFSLQALIFAVGLFLSVTTTIPYAVIIGLFTFVIATPLEQADPEASLRTALWRILLTCVGVVLGTLGQMLLWPEKPEKLLLQELATHMRRGEEILERVLSRQKVAILSPTHLPSNVSAAVVASQLDLLASAEAGASQLKKFHVEQIKLITDVELIFGLSVRLQSVMDDEFSSVPDALRVRVQNLQAEMARLRLGMKLGKASPKAMIYEPVGSPLNLALRKESPPVFAVVQKLESCLQQLPASMAFLEAQKNEEVGLDRIREPIAPGNFFSPAFSLSNIPAVQYALKGTLAASVCYVLYQSLNWPGISTCVVTAVIAMQSSFGGSVQKSVLRLLGAVLGAVMSIGIITIVMPNMDTVASVVAVLIIPFFVSGWIVTGSNKVSYAGLQCAMAVALVLLDRLGPTTNLAPAGDRILGIMIGVVIMGFISLTLWPNFAGKTLQKKLSDATRALANISRKMGELARSKFDLVTGQAHREITSLLTLYDESMHEFGSRKITEADRKKSLALISRLQEIFLSLLAVSRRRTALDQNALPAIWQQRLQTLDESIARRLELLADLETKPNSMSLPDPDQSLMDFKNALNEPTVLTEAEAKLPDKLIDLAALYGEIIVALENLQTDRKNTVVAAS